MTDEEPEIGKIKSKEPKHSWLSAQQGWNVSPGLPEHRAPGIFTRETSTGMLMTTGVSRLTAVSGWGNSLVLVSVMLFQDQFTGR